MCWPPWTNGWIIRATFSGRILLSHTRECTNNRESQVALIFGQALWNLRSCRLHFELTKMVRSRLFVKEAPLENCLPAWCTIVLFDFCHYHKLNSVLTYTDSSTVAKLLSKILGVLQNRAFGSLARHRPGLWLECRLKHCTRRVEWEIIFPNETDNTLT